MEINSINLIQKNPHEDEQIGLHVGASLSATMPLVALIELLISKQIITKKEINASFEANLPKIDAETSAGSVAIPVWSSLKDRFR